MSSDLTMQQIEEEFDKLIEEQAKKYRNRWIPCSKRLPKKPGYYLVTLESNFIVNNDHVKNIDVFYFEKNTFGKINGWEVTAWMPMPKPYKGENE